MNAVNGFFALASRSSHARTTESDVGLNEKLKLHLSESQGAAPKEAPTHRRANSSPVRLAETVKPGWLMACFAIILSELFSTILI